MKTLHQHIITTHIDTSYMWKPIKGENHNFIIIVMERKASTPYHIPFSIGFNVKNAATSVFCRLQHTRKLQLPYFSIDYNP